MAVSSHVLRAIRNLKERVTYMKKSGLISKFLLSLNLFHLLAGILVAGAPNFISYQGKLTDPSGTPVSTQETLHFNFYNGAGNKVNPSEINLTVTPDNGVFSVLIPVQPEWFSSGETYLGIKVGAGNEMTPRQRIVSSAYALSVADNAVDTAHIKDSAVTNDKLAGSIKREKLDLSSEILSVYGTDDGRLILNPNYMSSLCGINSGNNSGLYTDCNGNCDQAAPKDCQATTVVGSIWR